MPPTFELHERIRAKPDGGDTPVDIAAALAIMSFIIGTGLFLAGWQ